MLLVSDEFYDGVRQTALSAENSIFITSAFIKEKAIEALLQDIPNSVKVEIVGRWRKNDLLMKASDLAVYELCRDNGWKFGIDQNLHGKLYLVDDSDVFLGSANLTQKGMSIGGFGNVEFGARFNAAQLDISRIRAYKNSEVIWVDEPLFELLKKEVDEAKLDDSDNTQMGWSSDVLDRLETPVDSLWVNELMFVGPQSLKYPDLDDENTMHDFEMLGLHCDNLGEENITAQFRQTRVYSWLRYQLNVEESLNFGGLTHRLHNSLFDDPLPYRKEIKEFVSVLFLWLECLHEEFEMTKHNRTTSVRLLN